MKSIEGLIKFQDFLHDFQRIERVVDVPGRKAPENDVEHSFHLAMAAWYLSDDFPELDRDKLIRYALIHDIVEVHAGDTFFWADEAEKSTKVDREAAALKKIAVDWKEFPELAATMEEYEAKQNEEAEFIYALDKIMPMIVIMNAGGKTWHDHGITFEQQRKAKLEKIKDSKHILPYFNQLIELLRERPELFAK